MHVGSVQVPRPSGSGAASAPAAAAAAIPSTGGEADDLDSVDESMLESSPARAGGPAGSGGGGLGGPMQSRPLMEWPQGDGLGGSTSSSAAGGVDPWQCAREGSPEALASLLDAPSAALAPDAQVRSSSSGGGGSVCGRPGQSPPPLSSPPPPRARTRRARASCTRPRTGATWARWRYCWRGAHPRAPRSRRGAARRCTTRPWAGTRRPWGRCCARGRTRGRGTGRGSRPGSWRRARARTRGRCGRS